MFLVLSSQPCGSNTYFISIVTTNWLGLLLPLRYCGCCCSFWRRTRIVIDNSRGELEWRWKWIRFLLLTFHMTVNFCSGSIILHYFPAACIKSPLRQIKTFLLFGQVCLSSWKVHKLMPCWILRQRWEYSDYRMRFGYIISRCWSQTEIALGVRSTLPLCRTCPSSLCSMHDFFHMYVGVEAPWWTHCNILLATICRFLLSALFNLEINTHLNVRQKLPWFWYAAETAHFERLECWNCSLDYVNSVGEEEWQWQVRVAGGNLIRWWGVRWSSSVVSGNGGDAWCCQ